LELTLPSIIDGDCKEYLSQKQRAHFNAISIRVSEARRDIGLRPPDAGDLLDKAGLVGAKIVCLFIALVDLEEPAFTL
jgi:hypothetical protein